MICFEKKEPEEEVLYSLPITHKWIFQFILALILICHCSYRGVKEILRDLFDYSISIGTIHNRVTAAVEQARQINQTQDLSSIGVALLDELFHASQPVLTVDGQVFSLPAIARGSHFLQPLGNLCKTRNFYSSNLIAERLTGQSLSAIID